MPIMKRTIALMLGIMLIAGGLLGASLDLGTAGDVRAQEPPHAEENRGNRGNADASQRSRVHEQMHAMMDAMMGEGFTERMHAAMPESEAMMEACASGMGGMMSGDGMMSGEGMMDGMPTDGMIGER